MNMWAKMKRRNIVIAVIVIVIIGVLVIRARHTGETNVQTKIVHPKIGDIHSTISTTGTVLPKNRLEVKPPVNGRIESILVQEGDMVKAGQTVAWMSSTDRAALLDAARSGGPEAMKYWQEVYKPISLISPIDGEVIVATIQPGQTVTTADAVVVLSDKLIVRAQVDETDIANIKPGQTCVITIDAYPEQKVDAKVEHVYYESTTVNNVTIYNVDLAPETIPDFYRSGMNATIAFVAEKKEGALLLPVNAVQREKGGKAFVLVREGNKDVKQPVTTGVTDDKNIEILSGVEADSDVVVTTKKYAVPKASGGSPFTASRSGK